MLPKTITNDNDVHGVGDEMIFSPYNPLNKEISQREVELFLKKYGINTKIFNFNLYRRAFIHKSYTKRPFLENEQNNITIEERPADCLPLKTKSNERLEFLGDGVLELITKYYLYRRFPKANEGFMTEKKIALVKNEAIGKLAYDMGLNKWYIMSKNAEAKKTRTNLKKLGCLFEAFIGAIFLDYNRININDEYGWFKNVFNLSNELVDRFDSMVPNNLNDLMSLPGVGRKTANVVLNIAFGHKTMAVDTHVYRVSRRSGLASGENVLNVEESLVSRIPNK